MKNIRINDGTFSLLTAHSLYQFCADEAYRRLLWNEGDEKYYPLGVDDPDYCVIEFTAERADYYRYDGKGTLGADALEQTDVRKAYENGYARRHAEE